MRQFTATLDIPTLCDCCDSPLKPLGAGISRGKFRLEFSEPAQFSLGEFVKLTIGGGKLHVALRQNRGSKSGWALKPHYNTGAFARMKRDVQVDANQPEVVWYNFSFELPEFRPGFATWWAELVFFEDVPFKQGFNGGPVEAHNAASFRVKLETLD
jgi:hypothetical protein